MSYEGVESRSDGVHWIHRKRIDSTGKVYQTITAVLKLEKGDWEKLSFGQSCGIRPTGFDRTQIIIFFFLYQLVILVL